MNTPIEVRTNKKLISFSDRNLDMMEALMKETGWNTPTQIVRRGIEELYKNTFKYGKDPILGSGNIEVNTIEKIAERKVKLKVAQEKVAQDLKDKPKIDRCLNILKGEIITNPDGSKICKWQTHDAHKSHDQSISLSQCGEYLVDNLFMPDRETVLKARPELRSKFE